MNNEDIFPVIIVVTLAILVLVVFFLYLLVVVANRKNKHRIEIAEMQQKFDREVRSAEREAVQSTLHEIGCELHDNLGQLLAAVQIGLMNRFSEELDQDVQLAAVLETLEQSVDEVSRLGRSLNTDWWNHQNIFRAIHTEAARIESLGYGIVHIHETGPEVCLPADESILLFRVFQEVMGNALKHSQATVIHIELQSHPFSIRITDNGIGFNPDKTVQGSGLKNIRYRCRLVGIRPVLTASPGKGCCWTFSKNNTDGT